MLNISKYDLKILVRLVTNTRSTLSKPRQGKHIGSCLLKEERHLQVATCERKIIGFLFLFILILTSLKFENFEL